MKKRDSDEALDQIQQGKSIRFDSGIVLEKFFSLQKVMNSATCFGLNQVKSI